MQAKEYFGASLDACRYHALLGLFKSPTYPEIMTFIFGIAEFSAGVKAFMALGK